MKYLFSIMLISLMGGTAFAQCNVKTINRPDGVVVKYMNPELVGKGNNCELGLSVQTNGDSYFLTTTVRYFGTSKKLTGDLKIQNSSNS